MRFPMVQPVTQMTRSALGDRLAPGAEEYLDMFHHDAVFEFPFSPGGPVSVHGKAAMAEYLSEIEGSTIFDRFDLTAAHPARGGGMVLEYRSQARAGRSQTPFSQDYVCVVSISDGRIDAYREHLDPLNIPGVAQSAADTTLDLTPLTGEVTSLEDILVAALGDRLDPAAGSFLDMFADDGVLQCPFAPSGALHRLTGREAIVDYHRQLAAVQGSDGMVLTADHTSPGGPALLEYEGMVRNNRDGSTYRQKYVAVVEVDDGHLTLFREYWNPLPLVASFGVSGPVPVDEARSS